MCHPLQGPSFGDSELLTYEPFLGEGKLFSAVGGDGFKIEGNFGDIHPLTGEKIQKDERGNLYGEGTLIEIEVWHLEFLP